MKTALVLEGGGLRGVYTEGVLDALMQAGWTADYVVGVSAGANNGIYYVAGQPGAALGSVLDYVGDRRYLSLENYIRTHSVFGMDFIFHD
ncbi:MAG: patatin-like phospholipase family protein, partial [Christensenellaceae bacterium]